MEWGWEGKEGHVGVVQLGRGRMLGPAQRRLAHKPFVLLPRPCCRALQLWRLRGPLLLHPAHGEERQQPRGVCAR